MIVFALFQDPYTPTVEVYLKLDTEDYTPGVDHSYYAGCAIHQFEYLLPTAVTRTFEFVEFCESRGGRRYEPWHR